MPVCMHHLQSPGFFLNAWFWLYPPRKGESRGTDPMGHICSSFGSMKRSGTSIPTLNQDLHPEWVLFAMWSASAARTDAKRKDRAPFLPHAAFTNVLLNRLPVGCRSQECATKCGREGFHCTKAGRITVQRESCLCAGPIRCLYSF